MNAWLVTELLFIFGVQQVCRISSVVNALCIEWNPECNQTVCARFSLAIDSIWRCARVNKLLRFKRPCDERQCSVAEKGHCLIWLCRVYRSQTALATAVLEPSAFASNLTSKCNAFHQNANNSQRNFNKLTNRRDS